MSRGPGRIGRAIEAAFQRTTDDVWTLSELAHEVYPDTKEPCIDYCNGAVTGDGVKKRHRVSLTRAARNVCRPYELGRDEHHKGNCLFQPMQRALFHSRMSL